MSATDSTFLLLVAKCPCQKRVSFSRSGSGPWTMRLSQQTLSSSMFDEVRAVWRRLSIASTRFGRELRRVEEPLDAGCWAGLEVAEQFRSRRAEAGAAVQVGDLAEIPRIVGLGS